MGVTGNGKVGRGSFLRQHSTATSRVKGWLQKKKRKKKEGSTTRKEDQDAQK